jgi:hypothetical protein
MPTRKREQVTVPLPPNLRHFIERAAHEQDRSLAGQIRHLLNRTQGASAKGGDPRASG